MKLKKININFIGFLFHAIVVFISSMYLFKIAEEGLLIKNVDYKLLIKLFFIGLFLYILFLKIIKKYKSRLYLFIGLVLVIIFFMYSQKLLVIKFNRNIIENYNNIKIKMISIEKIKFSDMKLLLKTFLPLVYFIIFFITEKLWQNLMPFISAITLIGLWFFNYKLALKYLDKIIFINLFIIICNIYIKNIKILIKNKAKISIKPVRFISFLLVITIIITKMLKMLPIKREGRIKKEIYWNYCDNLIYDNKESYQSKEGFDLAQIGYSENYKKLGGSIELNYKNLMSVRADKPYYLKGTVKDEYTGYSWNNSFEKYVPYNKLVYFNIYKLGTNKNYSSPEQYNVRQKNIEIGFENDFKSHTFFSPNLAQKLRINQDGSIYYDKEQNIRFSKEINKKYNIDFLEVRDINNLLLEEEVLKTDTIYSYYMNYMISKKNSKFSMWIENFDYGEFNEIIKKEYNKYMQLPNNIPNEVYELVEKITKNTSSSLEKVNKIKSYLEMNYRYSLKVNEIPNDHEFLSYFLFKEKKGYCTYFATAMTIMSRIAGIPARYVEGFKMKNNKNNVGIFRVGSEDAHAWCEVLVLPENNVWCIVDPKVSSLNNTVNRIENKPIILKERAKKKEKDKIELNEKKEKQEESKKEDKKEIKTKEIRKNKYNNIYKSLYLGISLVVFIVILNMAIIKYRKRKILKNKSLLPLYKYYLRKLKKINIRNDLNLSELEFAKQIREEKLRTKIIILTECIYAEKYGNQKININKEEYYNFINKYIKENIIKDKV